MSSNALISFCSRLPHATRDVKWGHDLVFSIGGKMFAVFDLEDTRRFSFKTTPDEFAVLTGLKGISPAPYAARFHWVAVGHPRPLGLSDVKTRLRKSYDLVAAKLPPGARKRLGLVAGPAQDRKKKRPREGRRASQ
jgi:predicted DNA-binding protein (MmcQ/YjbR family)